MVSVGRVVLLRRVGWSRYGLALPLSYGVSEGVSGWPNTKRERLYFSSTLSRPYILKGLGAM